MADGLAGAGNAIALDRHAKDNRKATGNQGATALVIRRIDAAAFVDWHAQLINSGAIGNPVAPRAAQIALDFVASQIALVLEDIDKQSYFSVTMKLYHGWHRGLTATANYTAIRNIVGNNLAPQRVRRVTYDWKQPFGCILSDALDHRLHPNIRVHLPNTLRAGIDDPNVDREKMTDTALACDVLSAVRSSPEDIRLILAEDDDFVPPAFVAEKWGKERGGRTFILRKREISDLINVKGIIRRMEIDGAQ